MPNLLSKKHFELERIKYHDESVLGNPALLSGWMLWPLCMVNAVHILAELLVHVPKIVH